LETAVFALFMLALALPGLIVAVFSRLAEVSESKPELEPRLRRHLSVG
jgi:hypothetical protein